MKLSDLKTAAEVLTDQLKDPSFREEWERTALARDVALRVTAFRVEHNLSQAALARKLGMQQPAIARLEAGMHEPSLSMLHRLATHLGMEFHITITPDADLIA
ncbi:MAG: helix-turn-helix transcriptional regulator [Chloroflexota bacterium]